MAVADHASATTVEADNAVRPSELTNDFIALRFVEQGHQLDQVHHGFRSLPHRERPTDQLPDQNQHAEILPRADCSLPGQGLFITPKPDKSQSININTIKRETSNEAHTCRWHHDAHSHLARHGGQYPHWRDDGAVR